MKKTILIVLVLTFVIGLIPGVANAKLVACVGDSITYGYGLPDLASNCYPAQLARILQQFDNQWETQNFGHSGATLLRNKVASYARQTAYTQALVSEPDVVVIMLGSNDSARATSSEIEQDFIPDYLALIDSFAQLPSQPRIFVCYPPPIFGGTYGSDTIIRDLIIPLIQQLPTYRDVEVIDMHTPLEESSHLFPDRVHPNTEGAGITAEVVASMILGFRGHPDLNSDETVDSADMCIMIDHWHTDNERCDIVPPPFGDGIVDVQDLILLSEHLFTYPGAVAYWKLDEIEGDIARDSAAVNDAVVFGGAVWQPDGGIIDGALQLDGVDDYVGSDFILNPAEGPFGVLAWIKGGVAGQVILSQEGGVNWLMTDAEGKLRTELQGLGRVTGPLQSQTVISDGQWHRVALVRDGSHRSLYVDGVVAAEDTQSTLAGSTNGLYIGCGKAMEPGTFWSGLIDDVRIYKRAVRP